MSYEKVKCITRNEKKNKIFITSACSNVRPLYFRKWEYGNDNMSYKEKMYSLLRDISGGNLQLNNSCYEWNYAILKTKEEFGKDYYLYDRTRSNYNIYTLENKQYFGERYIYVEKLEDNMIPLTERTDNTEYYIKKEKEKDDERIKQEFEKYYNVFIKYLEEKHEGKYYLYSKTYGNIKPKGTNGSFYYNLNSSMVETMNYKKAYCLAKNIDRDIEIKAVPTREYEPTQAQKEESKTRLSLLGLEDRFSEKLYLSDRYNIREVKDKEFDLIRAINDFEKEHNAYVYHIIYSYSSFGELFNMLYVSKYEEEWEQDKGDITTSQLYAYVWNKTTEYCSEIGLIGIEKYENSNLLKRTF